MNDFCFDGGRYVLIFKDFYTFLFDYLNLKQLTL